MFNQAQRFSIHGSQFNYYAHSGSQTVQNPVITYEQIKLKTPIAPSVFTGRDELLAQAVQKLVPR
ncbi:hypothetical protein GYMLUDRAFT_600825 [Collybiopsis luxurians FD-317 M1]|uniref:Uncharacterized protein n=1 Tax=Collybiopsis luxurians FD-317 M1 TaxID=944289 RepID=A0A0D0C4P9_9AGAR|nr:hypothetical protein GYMLUDRAFT_600825 [Collybiopsis luxurians FD-317 M1]